MQLASKHLWNLKVQENMFLLMPLIVSDICIDGTPFLVRTYANTVGEVVNSFEDNFNLFPSLYHLQIISNADMVTLRLCSRMSTCLAKFQAGFRLT